MQRPRSQPALSTGYAHISSALHRLEFREGCPKFRFQSGFPIETVSTSRVLDEPPFDVAFHRCLVAHYRHDADGNKSGKSKGTCTGLGQAERVLHAHLDKFAHLVDRRDGAMVENVTRLLSPRLLTLELGRSRRGES